MATVLPTQQRNAGTYSSGAINTPNPGTDHRITYTMTMSAADASDPTHQADILVEGTADATGATGWYLLMSETWVGGQLGRDGNPAVPTLSLGGGTPLPAMLRGTVTTNARWQWGVDMTTSAT